MFKQFGAPEILIVILIILLLFGAKRMPDAARGLGRSLRIFKAETKGLTDDSTDTADTTVPAVDKPAAPAAVDAPKPPAAPAPGTPVERADS